VTVSQKESHHTARIHINPPSSSHIFFTHPCFTHPSSKLRYCTDPVLLNAWCAHDRPLRQSQYSLTQPMIAAPALPHPCHPSRAEMRATGRLLYFRKQLKEDADDSTDWDELHGRKGQINIMTDVNEILNWDDAVSEQSVCAVLGEGRPPRCMRGRSYRETENQV
jgi:hypothetical protein